MEIPALCIRLLMFVIILLGAHVQKSYTQRDGAAFRVTTDRLQFFEYDTVSFHCHTRDGSTQLRGITTNKQILIQKYDVKRTSALTFTIQEAYETDSGEYWCETGRGQRSNTVNISVTTGSVILEIPALPVMERNNIILCCRNKTTSTTLPVYFYKGGLLIQSSDLSEMTINNVSKSDEGLYNCSIPDVGRSPGSWLSVRDFEENHLLDHHSLPASILWVAFTILMVALVLLVVGFLHMRKHKDSADGGVNVSLHLETNHSRNLQSEQNDNEPVYYNITFM